MVGGGCPSGGMQHQAWLQPAVLIQLQQRHGNAAVREFLGAPSSAARDAASASTVQRYDAFEHAQAGDTARASQTVSIASVDLTSGEINALADLYGSPEAPLAADPG